MRKVLRVVFHAATKQKTFSFDVVPVGDPEPRDLEIIWEVTKKIFEEKFLECFKMIKVKPRDFNEEDVGFALSEAFIWMSKMHGYTEEEANAFIDEQEI